LSKRSFSFPVADVRARALGEIHSRPYTLIPVSRVIFQVAFLTEANFVADQAILKALSLAQGVPAPAADTSHHTMSWGSGTLRWERHTEFSTYFWDTPAPAEFGAEIPVNPFGASFAAPGPFISGVRIEIRPDSEDVADVIANFDPTSLCQSMVADSQATVITDFRQDGDGLTKFLVLDHGMTDGARGMLAQRLLDIETYRTLAMMGLPLAQTLSPEIRQIETSFTAITQGMKQHARAEADATLSEITRLAAELRPMLPLASTASAPAAPITTSCSSASPCWPKRRSPATRRSAPSCSVGWRPPCAPASRSRSGRRTCRASSPAQRPFCAAGSMSNWKSSTPRS